MDIGDVNQRDVAERLESAEARPASAAAARRRASSRPGTSAARRGGQLDEIAPRNHLSSAQHRERACQSNRRRAANCGSPRWSAAIDTCRAFRRR